MVVFAVGAAKDDSGPDILGNTFHSHKSYNLRSRIEGPSCPLLGSLQLQFKMVVLFSSHLGKFLSII